MSTILLLVLSNIFMTFAWYGHLKYGHNWPLWKAVMVSWGIAFFEYWLAVPANRLGFGEFSGFQLKSYSSPRSRFCSRRPGCSHRRTPAS
jgi:uncharacterized protein (DUF486 family)